MQIAAQQAQIAAQAQKEKAAAHLRAQAEQDLREAKERENIKLKEHAAALEAQRIQSLREQEQRDAAVRFEQQQRDIEVARVQAQLAAVKAEADKALKKAEEEKAIADRKLIEAQNAKRQAEASPEQWTVDQTCKFVESLSDKLKPVAERMRKDGLDGDMLLSPDTDTLELQLLEEAKDVAPMIQSKLFSQINALRGPTRSPLKSPGAIHKLKTELEEKERQAAALRSAAAKPIHVKNDFQSNQHNHQHQHNDNKAPLPSSDPKLMSKIGAVQAVCAVCCRVCCVANQSYVPFVCVFPGRKRRRCSFENRSGSYYERSKCWWSGRAGHSNQRLITPLSAALCFSSSPSVVPVFYIRPISPPFPPHFHHTTLTSQTFPTDIFIHSFLPSRTVLSIRFHSMIQTPDIFVLSSYPVHHPFTLITSLPTNCGQPRYM